MANNTSNYGTRVTATANSSSSAVATIAGATSTTIYITDVSGSSDLAGATLQIKDGSTVIWQDRVSNTGAVVYNLSTPIACTMGNSASVTVTGTAACNANVVGFTINP